MKTKIKKKKERTELKISDKNACERIIEKYLEPYSLMPGSHLLSFK